MNWLMDKQPCPFACRRVAVRRVSLGTQLSCPSHSSGPTFNDIYTNICLVLDDALWFLQRPLTEPIREFVTVGLLVGGGGGEWEWQH